MRKSTKIGVEAPKLDTTIELIRSLSAMNAFHAEGKPHEILDFYKRTTMVGKSLIIDTFSDYYQFLRSITGKHVDWKSIKTKMADDDKSVIISAAIVEESPGFMEMFSKSPEFKYQICYNNFCLSIDILHKDQVQSSVQIDTTGVNILPEFTPSVTKCHMVKVLRLLSSFDTIPLASNIYIALLKYEH